LTIVFWEVEEWGEVFVVDVDLDTVGRERPAPVDASLGAHHQPKVRSVPPLTIPAVDEAGPLFVVECSGGLAVGDDAEARQEEEEGAGREEALRVVHHLVEVASAVLKNDKLSR